MSHSRFSTRQLALAGIIAGIYAGLTLLHPATAPVSAAEIYTAVTGRGDWENLLAAAPADYDLRTRYAALFGGSGDYLLGKEEELGQIVRFMANWQ